MVAEENPSASIKVVDRRRFNAAGGMRDNNAIEDRKKPLVPAAAQEAAQTAREQVKDTGLAGQRPAAAQKSSDLLPFVASLATNAMAAMGAIPQAKARGMPVDMELAREYIDIITMLKDRTSKNVSAAEAQTLQRLLAELQRTYVELTRPPMPPQAAMPAR